MTISKDRIIFVLVIIALVVFIIVRKPTVIIQSEDKSKVIRDSITVLTKELEAERLNTARLKKIGDSLLTIPPKIKIVYEKQKDFTSTANSNQLDSIIRANAGLPTR